MTAKKIGVRPPIKRPSFGFAPPSKRRWTPFVSLASAAPINGDGGVKSGSCANTHTAAANAMGMARYKFIVFPSFLNAKGDANLAHSVIWAGRRSRTHQPASAGAAQRSRRGYYGHRTARFKRGRFAASMSEGTSQKPPISAEDIYCFLSEGVTDYAFVTFDAENRI